MHNPQAKLAPRSSVGINLPVEHIRIDWDDVAQKMLRNCDKKTSSCIVNAYGDDRIALFQSIKACREVVDPSPESRDESLVCLFKKSTSNLKEVN